MSIGYTGRRAEAIRAGMPGRQVARVPRRTLDAADRSGSVLGAEEVSGFRRVAPRRRAWRAVAAVEDARGRRRRRTADVFGAPAARRIHVDAAWPPATACHPRDGGVGRAPSR